MFKGPGRNELTAFRYPFERHITLGRLIKNKLGIGDINRKMIRSKKLYLFLCAQVSVLMEVQQGPR